MAVTDTIRPLLQPVLSTLGLVLEDVTVTPAGKRRVVRVVIDRTLDSEGDVDAPTSPLTLDEVAEATHAVGAALDDSDALGASPYVLEVTSPGVDRPLRTPAQFRRNVGRLVSLTPLDGPGVTGRITRAGTEDLTLAVADGPKAAPRPVTVAYAALSKALVQVEFSRPPTPDAEES